MRSSLVVRASDCQCTRCNGPGFDTSIPRHSGIWGAADESVLHIERKKIKKSPQKIYMYIYIKNYVDQSWEYKNRSQIHECGNWHWGRAIPRKGIHKWDFPCSVTIARRPASITVQIIVPSTSLPLLSSTYTEQDTGQGRSSSLWLTPQAHCRAGIIQPRGNSPTHELAGVEGYRP